MSGSGWRDLSKISPTLPTGMVPVAFVGMVTMDGRGAGTGWLNINMGGVQVTGTFLNMTYQVNTDCTFQVSYSIKVKELGVNLGPDSRSFVIFPGGPNPGDRPLEAHGLLVGTGPSTTVDIAVIKRISVD